MDQQYYWYLPRRDDFEGVSVAGQQYPLLGYVPSTAARPANFATGSSAYDFSFMWQHQRLGVEFTVSQYSYHQPQQRVSVPIRLPMLSYSSPPVSNYRAQSKPIISTPYQTYSPESDLSDDGSYSPVVERTLSASSDPITLPNGPPRRPKQSGFALWIGNLPSDVNVKQLKDFFAMDGLESICFIQKSRCAFVNYKTEEVSKNAFAKFNHQGRPHSSFSRVFLTL
jgi:RNA recognition motif. (a.k.a. RRM, RBD, or RNP domain)